MKRSPCPDWSVLGSFIDPASGGLPEKDRNDVARHVNRCRSCFALVQNITRDLGGKLPRGVVARVIREAD